MVSASALAHSLNKLLAVPEEGTSGNPRCASRSTSVGSISSHGHSGSLDSASASEIQSPELGVCEARDWAPVFVRNTFLDAPPGIPQSLIGFFQEREVHSCPASGIGAPPGLIATEETTRFAAAPAPEAKLTTEFTPGLTSYCASDTLGLPEYDYPAPFNVAADSTPKTQSEVDGFHFQPCAFRSFPNSEFSMAGLSGIGMIDCRGESVKVRVQNPPFAEAFPQSRELPSAVSDSSETVKLAQLVEALRAENEMLRASLQTSNAREVGAAPSASVLPIVSAAPMHPAPVAKAPLFLAPSLLPPPPTVQADISVLPQVLRETADQISAPEQPMRGSPELPSIGSAGHYAGQCKPCVHFWKKGCMNGTECPFCHLCDADEVKRRQSKKATFRKQVAVKAARSQGNVRTGPAFAGR